MKRLIAAAILLVFVAASYFGAYLYIQDTCKEASRLLSECVLAYDSSGNAESQAKKLDEYWGKKEKPLSVFANHGKIDEIELAIYSMLLYSNTQEKEIFHEYSGTVKTLLHQLMEDTVPSMHSIL